MNILLYGRSATHRGTGPDTYSNYLISALAGKCTLGEYAQGVPQETDWDLVHVLDMKHVTRGFLKETTLPVVMDVHDTYWLEKVAYPCQDRWVRIWLNRRRRRQYPRILARASRIVVHSRYVSRTLREYLPIGQKDRVVYVPYAMTVSEPSPDRPIKNTSRILFAGRDLFRKGFPTFVDAFSLLLKRMPKVELSVVGQEYYHSLRWARRRCQGLPVTFLGGLNPTDLHKEILRSDVVVLPSYTEAFGIILIEAQALGIPVIGTRVGGIPETMAENDTGLLVPPYDPGALADAMEKLLKDPNRRRMMGEQGREWIKKKYSHALMAESLLEVYESVAKDG